MLRRGALIDLRRTQLQARSAVVRSCREISSSTLSTLAAIFKGCRTFALSGWRGPAFSQAMAIRRRAMAERYLYNINRLKSGNSPGSPAKPFEGRDAGLIAAHGLAVKKAARPGRLSSHINLIGTSRALCESAPQCTW